MDPHHIKLVQSLTRSMPTVYPILRFYHFFQKCVLESNKHEVCKNTLTQEPLKNKNVISGAIAEQFRACVCSGFVVRDPGLNPTWKRFF